MRALRSKQGCWTCRLRKKKCGEETPICSNCQSLSITCYGFGPKPDWMDNGDKEKAVAKNIQEIVKRTSRRKGTTNPIPRNEINLAPKIMKRALDSSSGTGSKSQSATPPLEHGLPQVVAVRLPQEEEFGFPVTAEDSAVLMNFLDYVFPLQYPMYRPGVQQGGRGWLLALIIRTKTLYHVVSALSAHHFRVTALTWGTQATTSLQQEKHLEICLKLVSQHAKGSCPKNGIGLVTTIIQLVFFELFVGHGKVWEAHLKAAMNMYRRGYDQSLESFGLSDEAKIILLNDQPMSGYKPVVTDEVANFRFLGGTMIWLDIISSITAGTAPFLQPYHFEVITSTSLTKLEEIMGCKNWAMLQIGRIAALYQDSRRSLQQGEIDCSVFDDTVQDIGREIELCSLTQGSLDGFTIFEYGPAPTFHSTVDTTAFITRLFACMASIYLHLVTHGFQNLETLDGMVSEAMSMLQTQYPIHLLPVVVSPLYFIGCVARQEDEKFFREVFSSPPMLDSLHRHREKILPILEEVWTRRQDATIFTWRDSLEITDNILLI